MALISEETVLEVKRTVDIVEVAKAYFPLKRAGANYKALCPFHEEKTPSFNVHPEKQIFKCFGCGKAGDAIGLVMDYEKLDYPDAIRTLAERNGVPVRYKDGGGGGPDRESLHQANLWAAHLFRGYLRTAPEAEGARRFLGERGVSDETAELFGIGYSMDSWDHLLKQARRAGTSERTLAAAGLAVQKEGNGGFYDRFRGRLMFPITDALGKAAAFGARTLKDEKPKFVNSPETAVFSKGRTLYGLRLAKEEWERTGTAYVAEGYLDVVVPYQAGVRGIVATLGTALTREHLRLLQRKGVRRVVLVFDADPAGQKANERGLDLLISENMDIFVAELPEGKDPDDVVRESGVDALRRMLEAPKDVFEFLMDALSARHKGNTPSTQSRIVEDVAERLAQMPNEIKRELLIQQVAKRFKIEERVVRAKAVRPEDGQATPTKASLSPDETNARRILSHMLAEPSLAAIVRNEVAPEDFPTEATARVAALAYELFDRDGAVDGGELIALLQDRAAMQAATDIVEMMPSWEEGIEERIAEWVMELKDGRRHVAPLEVRGER